MGLVLNLHGKLKSEGRWRFDRYHLWRNGFGEPSSSLAVGNMKASSSCWIRITRNWVHVMPQSGL